MIVLWNYSWLMQGVIVYLASVSNAVKDSSKTGLIPTARCRARCLSKFIKDAINNEGCQSDVNCDSCWSVCEALFHSYDVWKDVCDNEIACRSGCQVACQFKKALPNITISEYWKFLEIPAVTTEPRLRRGHIAWSQPVLNSTLAAMATRVKPYIVYVLLVRDLMKSVNHWKQLLQSAKTEANLDLLALPYHPEFWLIAVGENGTMTEVRFNVSVSQHLPYQSEIIDIEDNKGLRAVEGAVVQHDPTSTLNLTITMTFTNGRILPILTWTNPNVLPQSGHAKELVYLIDYYLNDCDCELPEEHFADTLITDVMKQPQYTFHDIAFGAEYFVEINLKNDNMWHGEITFHTPKCHKTDFLRPSVCLLDTKVKQTFFTKSTTPTSPLISFQTLFHDTDASAIEWNIINTRLEYDAVSRHVFVYINWSMPLHFSKVKTEIIWRNLVDPHHVDAGRKELKTSLVDSTYEILKVKPDNVYKIYATATYLDDKGIKREIQSNSLLVYTNNTDGMHPVLASRVSSIVEEKDILNGIILGVTVVSSIIIVGIIILFVYKKRQSFNEIIITKSAEAESNSYKSNVGYKVDFSNEMLIIGDEWEIDCRQLQFASNIGQGAFGKVVTGYYRDQRVAIKLVRDCAPLSYKEDLLAEISLMKRIGQHPNIVSMIGACTFMEPICLVMEFVPYGNLQNFLRKFRSERKITVQAGQRTEISYAIVDEHGGTNEEVTLKPSDLLSFARQVAMAMEYLGEKKYVHRDLAARNVLLGFDKIIKVCDFGLSREIFSDNQYVKLTNGKLPLKWMAIESLRDRVFTTQSDVWSFGILLWEIVTLGGLSPYQNIALDDLYSLLSNNYRMEKPSNCSDEIYIIMRQCWLEDPAERPNFTELRVQLELLLTRDCNYLELDNVNVPLPTPESSSGTPVSDDTKSLLTAPALQTRRTNSNDVSAHDQAVERLLRRQSEFNCHGITIL